MHRGFTAVHSIDLDAALVRCLRDRRDEVAYFLWLVWISHIDRSNAGIEVGDEGDLLVKDRRHALVRRMCAETSTPLAEISVRLRHEEIRDHHRFRFNRHIDEEHYLSRLLAFIENLLVHDHQEYEYLAVLVLSIFPDRHVRHREDRVRAVERQHVESTHDRIAQVLWRRLLWAVEKLFAINDLQNAALVGAVAEIDSVALRPGRNRPM